MSLSQDVTEALEGAELWYVATTDGTNPNVVPVGYKWLHEGSLLLWAWLLSLISPLTTLANLM